MIFILFSFLAKNFKLEGKFKTQPVFKIKNIFLQVQTMKKIEEFGKANPLKPNVSFLQ